MKKLKFIVLLVLMSSLVLRAQPWQSIGPFNRTGPSGSNGQGSGQVHAIAYHPKYNTADASIGGAINKTIFIGSAYGGLWMSRNDGLTWSTTDPLLQYPNVGTDFFRGCGVVDIAIDNTTPTTMYAAFSSSEFAPGYTLMGNYFPSTGIYKYTPATGWVAKKAFPYLSNHFIRTIAISPSSSSTIFACTDDGLIRSTDAGTNWSAPIVTEGTGKPFRNLVFDPTNPSIAFTCGREVYKSIDGGTSFTAISNFVPMISDISSEGIVQTNIAVISSTSIYARVFYTVINTKTSKEAFFHYNGTTWTARPIFPEVVTYHYNRMPLIAKKVGSIEYVFAGSEVVNLYNSSTNTWSALSTYNGTMHADIHDFAFSPDGSSLMVAHDGGISVATSNFYTTPNWTVRNTGLSLAILVSFAGSQKDPALFLTGEIDNGNSIVKNATSASPTWSGYLVCDGADKMISPSNPNDWYDRQQMYGGTGIYRNTTGNEASAYNNQIFTNASIQPPPYFDDAHRWDSHYLFEEWGDKKPLVMDPNNPNVVYRGANILMRSMDNGLTSQVIFRKSDCFDVNNTDVDGHINTIAIAPSNSNYLYIGFSNPYPWHTALSNHIYKTTNALSPTYAAPCPHSATNGVVCANWQDITPPFPAIAASLLKQSEICIAVSDKDPNLIWAGFTYNPNAPTFLLWKFDGTTWSNYGQGLPANMGITSLVYEKGSNDGLYAGTDVAGVFYRNKTMSSWIPFGTGMTHAKVMQMEVNNTENTVRAGTYGRGIWKNSLFCPTAPYTSPNPCNECNSSTNYFWEGTNVTLINTTLTTNKHFVRAVDSIDVLPNTTLTASATANYDLYIHGCGPTQKNSYRKIDDLYLDDDHLVIDSGEKEAIAVYPNPNNGLFTLKVDSKNAKNIYVYDMLGKIVYEKIATTDEQFNIDITKNPKGLYVIRVMDEDGVKTVKVINK